MADAARARFDMFVLFAEMRTGSNYLEDNLNQMPGLACHGELFNPHFVGQHNRNEKFGVNLRDRDANPDPLLILKSREPGLPGKLEIWSSCRTDWMRTTDGTNLS